MVKKSKTKIVILGAGFAGIKSAQILGKKLPKDRYEITVIDKSARHVFHPDLYEIATAFSKKVTEDCITRVRDSVATPMTTLLPKKRIKFIQGEITAIDPQAKIISLDQKQVKFDYLIVALGSVTNYYKIPGLKKYSYPLKTDQDALKINCDLDHYFQKNHTKNTKGICINIGGGGATGVETAAEFIGYLKKISAKYDYPFNKIKINLIEGGNTLAGQDRATTQRIKTRLASLGVKVHLNSFITKATKTTVTIKPKKGPAKNLPSDILIWNGGVKSNPIIAKYLGNPKKNGAIPVNQYLQSIKNPYIFAAGDNAFFPDPQDPQNRLPMLAQVADNQGRSIAHNLIRHFQNRPAQPYNPQTHFYIIPIGGTYALFKTPKHVFFGRWCWYLRRIAYLRYMLTILPPFKALKKWYHGTVLYQEND